MIGLCGPPHNTNDARGKRIEGVSTLNSLFLCLINDVAVVYSTNHLPH
jgi:hypothetical protein